jgi:hypothetical protein
VKFIDAHGGRLAPLRDYWARVTRRARIGHSSLSMARRYSRLAPDHLRSEVAKTEKPRPAAVAVKSAHGTPTSHEVESERPSLVSA